jgi:uncharacterized protein YdaU (DUF1376 family)
VSEKVDIFMPLFVADYLADTTDLTAEEHGAYLLLLMAAWRQGGILENSPHRLARAARVPAERWPAVWEAIERFFDVDELTVTQGRLMEELTRAREQKAAASERGKRGAAARHHAGAMLKQVTSTAQALEQVCSPPSPSEKEPSPRAIHGTTGGDEINPGELMAIWGRTRNEEFGGHPFNVNGSGVKSEAQRNAADFISATVGAKRHVEASMRRFWQDVKAGRHREAKQISRQPGFAFACWFALFPGDFEEAIGVMPAIPIAKDGRRTAPRAPPTPGDAARSVQRSERPLGISYEKT